MDVGFSVLLCMFRLLFCLFLLMIMTFDMVIHPSPRVGHLINQKHNPHLAPPIPGGGGGGGGGGGSGACD